MLQKQLKYWRNNQNITACNVKVYLYKMTINKKSIMTSLEEYPLEKLKSCK